MSAIEMQCPLCGTTGLADIEGPTILYFACGHSAKPGTNRLACPPCTKRKGRLATTGRPICADCGAPTVPRWEVQSSDQKAGETVTVEALEIATKALDRIHYQAEHGRSPRDIAADALHEIATLKGAE